MTYHMTKSFQGSGGTIDQSEDMMRARAPNGALQWAFRRYDGIPPEGPENEVVIVINCNRCDRSPIGHGQGRLRSASSSPSKGGKPQLEWSPSLYFRCIFSEWAYQHRHDEPPSFAFNQSQGKSSSKSGFQRFGIM